MSPARIVDNSVCRTSSRHTISFDSYSMAGSGLYYRPVVCKFCDKIFDFPTLTTDITEKYATPSSSKYCMSDLIPQGRTSKNKNLQQMSLGGTLSLSECNMRNHTDQPQMGHDEGLRERRANAEAAMQRSFLTISEKTLPIVNGHKASLSSVATNETSSTDADLTAHSNEPYVCACCSVSRSSRIPTETRASSEPRNMSDVRNILN